MVSVQELAAKYFEMGLLYRDSVAVLKTTHDFMISERHFKEFYVEWQ